MAASLRYRQLAENCIRVLHLDGLGYHAPKVPGRALWDGFVGASARENKCF
jgi:hypothetical protein